MILNYALKLGYTPLLCDLDLENEISIPGSIGACLVDHLVPNNLLFDNSISYFFGDVYNKNSDNMNWSLYEMQLIELGNACYEKLEIDLQTWKKRMNIENILLINIKSLIYLLLKMKNLKILLIILLKI